MIGQTISHYSILEKLGEGGMGVVYKAQDTKLNRFAALKFLPAHLSASEQDKARFLQEAQAAASLNHPNICTIHGIEEHEGRLFIVMEFVDGQTLREKAPTVSSKQALEIGIQLADGLAAAHEKGIIHRDIKPENIMIRRDGIVQIMDFGLAKLRGASRLTKEGSTVGTIGYMSPEQVQGQEADHRTDIFSLGVILYELLAGQSPFRGVHETAIMYEIVNVEPQPVSSLKPEVHPELDAIALECLAKDPDERYQSVKEVAKDLRRFKRESSKARVSRISTARNLPYALSGVAPQSSGTVHLHSLQTTAFPSGRDIQPLHSPSRIGWIPWLLAGLFFVTSIFLGGYSYLVRGQVSLPQVVRSSLLPPERTSFNNQDGGHFALSPDGSRLAFVGIDSLGRNHLWIRPLNSLAPLQLAGTEGATYPFWSPDGNFLAYFGGGKLKKIEATGGPSLIICDAAAGRGGTWNSKDVIVFSPKAAGGLSRVVATGGVPTPLTQVDTSVSGASHRWPFFLPDGNTFLYTTLLPGQSSSQGNAVFIASLDSAMNKVLIHVPSNAAFFAGNLLYVSQTTLLARPLDLEKYEVTGDARALAEIVQFSDARLKANYSLSNNGILIYQPVTSSTTQLALFDRNGNQIQTVGDKLPAFRGALSPDGKKTAIDPRDPEKNNSDIWLSEISRGVTTRFTYDASDDIVPLWSPDGSEILFSSNRTGTFSLYRKSLSGTSSEELLLDAKREAFATHWSVDGRFVVLSTRANSGAKWDLWVLPMFGERKPLPFLQTEFNEWLGVFSPNARWIAYQSDESGRYEIYVRSFPDSTSKGQISTRGGTGPVWLEGGNEMLYRSPDRKMISVSLRQTGRTLEVISERVLFEWEPRGIVNVTDVSSTGERMLATVAGSRQVIAPPALVTNWDAELRKK